MCLDKRVVVAALFIVASLHITVDFTSARVSRKGNNNGDVCVKHKRFNNAKKDIINSRKEVLRDFIIFCSKQTFFEVRYTNGSLCACGQTSSKTLMSRLHCRENLLSNFTVYISVKERLVESRTCHFLFFLNHPGHKEELIKIVLKNSFYEPSSLSGMSARSSAMHLDVSKSILTTSVFGQMRSRSSDISNQFTTGKLSAISRQIRSTVAKQKFSQSLVASNTGIVFTSTTSKENSPIQSMSSSFLIQATPSISSVLSTRARQKFSRSLVASNTGIVFTSTTSKENSPIQSMSSSFLVRATPSISSVLSTRAKQKFSQSLVASNTGIVFTSAISMEDSPIQSTSSSFLIQATPSTSSSPLSTIILPSDEEKKEKLKEDIKFVNNFNASNVNINDKKTIERVLDAAANLINTNLTAENQNEDPGMQAVEVLEDLGNSISQQLALPENESSVIFQEVTDDLVFGVAVVNATTTPGFSFPTDESRTTGDEKINIPSSVFVSDSGKAYFVGIIFKPYREMRNKTGNFRMGTKVINAVVSPPPRKTLADPVEMTFKKNIIGETIASDCSFWIENATHLGEHGRWSTKQCEKTFENRSHVQCQCYHFTNFAVLFKVSDNQDVSDEDSFRLVIITYVGLSLSILGCFLTFVIYVTLSNIKTDRAVIHTNLVLALGVADVIFLVTVVVKPVGDSCLTLAMLAFFFYLAVFFWMLNEGVYIYFMVIKVFRGNDAMRRRMAYLVGWGCPAIIATVTWVVLRDDVVSKYHCWLSVESGAIWAFVGPGLLIILVNFIILMVVMRTTWAMFVGDKEYSGLKSATKTFGAVVPILGITWVFGVMAFNESSIVFQYIFAITNSIQGALIFILYCLVNSEVRSELRRKLTIWQTRREFSSSSGGSRRTYPYSVSSNTTLNRATIAVQATPDFYRCPMVEIKDEKSQGEVERRYSFEDGSTTSEKELVLGKQEKNGGEEG
ncbi:adhesion G-protein coupled receptor D1-like [Dendronephthya gigantea]|uniref:adhesion G-protein coupled receptor D1-like n=1 Tax=Dendronephthya gigantea TaxID=151771 RepID=UPI00106C9C0E|nr:adhesion G-protein coupled receptor D1-like [Dendronephthya gigantea]